MSAAYLLDTNIVAYWFDVGRPQHERVVHHIQELPETTPLMISAITSGEIEFGLHVTKGDTPKQEAFRAFIKTNLPMVLRCHESDQNLLRFAQSERIREVCAQCETP